MDRYMAGTTWEGQQIDEPLDRSRPDNLFEPVPGDHGAHGVFDERARDVAPFWLLDRNRVGIATAATVGAGVAAVAALTGLLRRRA